jgi:hypothetical protein
MQVLFLDGSSLVYPLWVRADTRCSGRNCSRIVHGLAEWAAATVPDVKYLYDITLDGEQDAGHTVARADLNTVRWVSHCRDLVQLPVAT